MSTILSEEKREAWRQKLRDAARQRLAAMTPEDHERKRQQGREAGAVTRAWWQNATPEQRTAAIEKIKAKMPARVPREEEWPAEQIERLRREYPAHALLKTVRLLANDLGRSPGAVKAKAKAIGITGKTPSLGRVGYIVAMRLRLSGVDLAAAIRHGTTISEARRVRIIEDAEEERAAARQRARDRRAAQATPDDDDMRLED